MRLTVFWDEQCQFWVGVIESEADNRLRACRYVFGGEPKDAEILDFIHHRLLALLDETTQTVDTAYKRERRVSPKRLIRLAARDMQQRGASTYAQQAMQLEYENRKKERQTVSKQMKELEKERKFQLKTEKAKRKHRGR